ncbi:hypothetical protein DICPUDRAFT_154222 [Dictyostelium purpureum]|uniref:Uncharacterized protein n=1 Tax=Dictyostelium purpureum TaxID=5786 RepID=F0ZQS4_DICPU|nr:uncharacterized protein DICPUDRAFT_154222 [Dictyostelium purpureum]EGC33690.1 hypothetical protein DICPUDRAFT_154222 [Dictyostelium purpureum]|eukprot:XP_003289767.1 hypothetical protein DICPUDRAFT_154222 [Dictyostelium purpureum]
MLFKSIVSLSSSQSSQPSNVLSKENTLNFDSNSVAETIQKKMMFFSRPYCF